MAIQFIDEAPYEIFSNNVLTFDDILRIKQTEESLKNIGTITAYREQWNISYQKSLKRHSISSNNSAPIGRIRAGQELGISWRISSYV